MRWRWVAVTVLVLSELLGHVARVHAASCVVTANSGMSFGGYVSNHRSPTDSTAFISYSCSGPDAPDFVVVELSRSESGRFIPRRAAGPGGWLEYNLYLDAARTLVWGDGTAGTSSFRSTSVGSRGRWITVPVYGRIPPRQNVVPGVYRDTVQITIVF